MNTRKSRAKPKVKDDTPNKDVLTPSNNSNKKTLFTPCRRMGLGKKRGNISSPVVFDINTENANNPSPSVAQENVENPSTSQVTTSVSPPTEEIPKSSASRRKKSSHPLKRKIDDTDKTEGNTYAVIVGANLKKRKLKIIDIFNTNNSQQPPNLNDNNILNNNPFDLKEITDSKNVLTNDLKQQTDSPIKHKSNFAVKVSLPLETSQKLLNSPIKNKVEQKEYHDKILKSDKNIVINNDINKCSELGNKPHLDSNFIVSSNTKSIRKKKSRDLQETEENKNAEITNMVNMLPSNNIDKKLIDNLNDIKPKSIKRKEKNKKNISTPKIKMKSPPNIKQLDNISNNINESITDDFDDDFETSTPKSKTKFTIKNKKIVTPLPNIRKRNTSNKNNSKKKNNRVIKIEINKDTIQVSDLDWGKNSYDEVDDNFKLSNKKVNHKNESIDKTVLKTNVSCNLSTITTNESSNLITTPCNTIPQTKSYHDETPSNLESDCCRNEVSSIEKTVSSVEDLQERDKISIISEKRVTKRRTNKKLQRKLPVKKKILYEEQLKTELQNNVDNLVNKNEKIQKINPNKSEILTKSWSEPGVSSTETDLKFHSESIPEIHATKGNFPESEIHCTNKEQNEIEESICKISEPIIKYVPERLTSKQNLRRNEIQCTNEEQNEIVQPTYKLREPVIKPVSERPASKKNLRGNEIHCFNKKQNEIVLPTCKISEPVINSLCERPASKRKLRGNTKKCTNEEQSKVEEVTDDRSKAVVKSIQTILTEELASKRNLRGSAIQCTSKEQNEIEQVIADRSKAAVKSIETILTEEFASKRNLRESEIQCTNEERNKIESVTGEISKPVTKSISEKIVSKSNLPDKLIEIGPDIETNKKIEIPITTDTKNDHIESNKGQIISTNNTISCCNKTELSTAKKKHDISDIKSTYADDQKKELANENEQLGTTSVESRSYEGSTPKKKLRYKCTQYDPNEIKSIIETGSSNESPRKCEQDDGNIKLHNNADYQDIQVKERENYCESDPQSSIDINTCISKQVSLDNELNNKSEPTKLESSNISDPLISKVKFRSKSKNILSEPLDLPCVEIINKNTLNSEQCNKSRKEINVNVDSCQKSELITSDDKLLIQSDQQVDSVIESAQENTPEIKLSHSQGKTNIDSELIERNNQQGILNEEHNQSEKQNTSTQKLSNESDEQLCTPTKIINKSSFDRSQIAELKKCFVTEKLQTVLEEVVKFPKNKAQRKYYNDLDPSFLIRKCSPTKKDSKSSKSCTRNKSSSQYKVEESMDGINDDSCDSSHYSTPAYSPIGESERLPEDKELIIQCCDMKQTSKKDGVLYECIINSPPGKENNTTKGNNELQSIETPSVNYSLEENILLNEERLRDVDLEFKQREKSSAAPKTKKLLNYYPRVLLSIDDIPNYYNYLETKKANVKNYINEPLNNKTNLVRQRSLGFSNRKRKRKSPDVETKISEEKLDYQSVENLLTSQTTHCSKHIQDKLTPKSKDKPLESVFFTPPSSRSENESDSNLIEPHLRQHNPFGEGTSHSSCNISEIINSTRKINKINHLFASQDSDDSYTAEDKEVATIATKKSDKKREKLKQKTASPLPSTSKVTSKFNYDSDDDFQTPNSQPKQIPSKSYIIKRDAGIKSILKNDPCNHLQKFRLTENSSMTAVHRGQCIEYNKSYDTYTRKKCPENVLNKSVIQKQCIYLPKCEKITSMFDSVVDEVARTDVITEIKAAEARIKTLKAKLEQLKLYDLYIKKHNLDKLHQNTLQIRKGGQESLLELAAVLRQRSATPFDMGTLLDNMNIPHHVVHYDMSLDEFT